MDVKKEKLLWIDNVANKITQIETDLDVIVPDSKPDIKKILQIDASVDSTTCEIQNDRVLICGNVCFNVIYMPEEFPMMQNIKVTTPFTDIIAISGVDSEMEGHIDVDVLSIDYRILNGRKFSVKCIVEAKLDVKKEANIEIFTGIEDEDIQTKYSELKMMMRSGRCNKNVVINEKMVIPESESSIGEVLNVAGKVNEYSIKLINNKAILKGDVKLMCTYAEAVNGNISTVNCVVPYTEILDIDGVKPEDTCNMQVKVKNCEYNCEESTNGEIRGVGVKCSLEVDLVTIREVLCNVVDDCYSLDKKINFDSVTVKLPRKISDINYLETLKTNITVSENEPLIDRVYDSFSKAYVEKVIIKKDQVVINGVVDNYVLYVTKDKEVPIYCVKNDVEFSHQINCNACKQIESNVGAEVLNTSYSLNSDNSLDLRINLKLSGVTYTFDENEVITKIEKTDIKLQYETASIIAYFVQDNETLWDVAKKYFTTTEAIININELEDDYLKKGMRLLIPKYKRT